MRIIEKTGTSLVLESVDTEQRLAEDTQKLLDYVKQCRQQCLELESVIESVQQRCSLREQFFPVILGRRPSGNLNDSRTSNSTSGTGVSSVGMESASTPSSGSGRHPTVSMACVVCRKATPPLVFGLPVRRLPASLLSKVFIAWNSYRLILGSYNLWSYW